MNQPTTQPETREAKTLSKTRYAVFYTNKQAPRELTCCFDDKTERGISQESFDSFYDYVGSFEGVSPDSIFQRLNTHEQQDLGHSDRPDDSVRVPEHQADVMQRLICRKCGHTSISVGDVLVDLSTGQAYYCQSDGWSKLTIGGEA